MGALDAVWLAVAMFIARRISQNIVVHRGVTNRLNHAPHLPQPPAWSSLPAWGGVRYTEAISSGGTLTSYMLSSTPKNAITAGL